MSEYIAKTPTSGYIKFDLAILPQAKAKEMIQNDWCHLKIYCDTSPNNQSPIYVQDAYGHPIVQKKMPKDFKSQWVAIWTVKEINDSTLARSNIADHITQHGTLQLVKHPASDDEWWDIKKDSIFRIWETNFKEIDFPNWNPPFEAKMSPNDTSWKENLSHIITMNTYIKDNNA